MVLITPVAAESGSEEEKIPPGLEAPEAGEQPVEVSPPAAGEAPDERELLFEDPGGAGEQPGEQLGEGVGAFGVWDFVRMLLVLALVIAAVYGVFYLLRRTAAGRFRNSELITLLGSQPLPGNRALHLVQVGSQIFLVGSGDSAVNLVSEITDRETIDELRLQAGETTEQSAWRGFAEVVSGVVGTEGRDAEHSGGVNPIQFMSRQRERLRKLR